MELLQCFRLLAAHWAGVRGLGAAMALTAAKEAKTVRRVENCILAVGLGAVCGWKGLLS